MKKINVTKYQQRAKALINEINRELKETQKFSQEELPSTIEMTKAQFISLLPHTSFLIAPQEMTTKDAVKYHNDFILYTPTAVMEVRIKSRGLW